MTTIVYDHDNKKIACDSRIIKDGVIRSDDYVKWRKDDTGVYFFSGTASDIEPFMKADKTIGAKSSSVLKLGAIKVDNDGNVFECSFCDNDGYWEMPLTHSTTMGSGEQFALAALDNKDSAERALRYAMTRDVYTGGTIYVYDIDKREFVV